MRRNCVHERRTLTTLVGSLSLNERQENKHFSPFGVRLHSAKEDLITKIGTYSRYILGTYSCFDKGCPKET